jgi:acetyl esterase/lipase
MLNRRDLLKLGGAIPFAAGGGSGLGQRAAAVPRAAERRAELYALLGDLPDRHRPIRGEKQSESERDGYILERWILDLNGLEPVPAFLARPREIRGRVPAILFNHSHGGGYDIGKKEFVEGRSYLQPTPYAKALTDAGYVALAIDHWVFGERHDQPEADVFKAMLWQGRVLWGMMVYDSLRALDFLAERPEVDPARIGTLGMSMGSTMAWWLAALDERVRATVDINCLTDFQSLLARKALSLHGVYYYVPALLKHFTTAQINVLIAPRAHLALAGLKDDLTPVEGLDIVEAELKRAYGELGHPERWSLLRYDVAHQETAEGREAALAFLRQHLEGDKD